MTRIADTSESSSPLSTSMRDETAGSSSLRKILQRTKRDADQRRESACCRSCGSTVVFVDGASTIAPASSDAKANGSKDCNWRRARRCAASSESRDIGASLGAPTVTAAVGSVVAEGVDVVVMPRAMSRCRYLVYENTPRRASSPISTTRELTLVVASRAAMRIGGQGVVGQVESGLDVAEPLDQHGLDVDLARLFERMLEVEGWQRDLVCFLARFFPADRRSGSFRSRWLRGYWRATPRRRSVQAR
ncbi:hypothetical protein L1887_48116 [Cichorium endivia]|nr:hypothetical protein L1887_48116 [Cichorium endivia]